MIFNNSQDISTSKSVDLTYYKYTSKVKSSTALTGKTVAKNTKGINKTR